MCEDQAVPRPATGKTPLRNIRVAGELWEAAKAKARAEDRSLSEVIVVYLRRYVSTPPRRKRSTDE
jgi:predicted HicB family RNase H-like nuclease